VLGTVSVRRISLFRSSTLLLTIVSVSLFTLSALLLLAFIFFYTANYMAEQTDATIEAEIAGLKERYKVNGLTGLTRLIKERIARKPTGSGLILLADQHFNVLVGNLSRWPDASETSDGWLNFRLEDKGWGEDAIHKARARPFRLIGGFHLLVGRDLHDLEMSKRAIAKTLISSLAFAAVLALVGGLAMTGSLIRRIEAINQTSNEIMNGDLSRRIPTNHTGDDFDQLSENLNHMLDRIEMLMEGVRQVSDNIAHDLRTPLARLRNHLDEVLQETARAGGDSECIERAIQEADDLLVTFNALLRIARIESKNRVEHFTFVELADLVRNVVDFYEPLVEEKNQQLDVFLSPGAKVQVDRELLSQTIANILDNSIKYTPGNGNIEVRITSEQGRVKLVIADSGPGIPWAERNKVFQRFYRLESSRSSPGNGLGLSLVYAVASLHNLDLKLESNNPGLRVIIVFPNLDQSAQKVNPLPIG